MSGSHQYCYSMYTKLTPGLKIKEYMCKVNKQPVLCIRNTLKEPILQKYRALTCWGKKKTKNILWNVINLLLKYLLPQASPFTAFGILRKIMLLRVVQAIHYFVIFSSNFPLAREYCPQTSSREKQGGGGRKSKVHMRSAVSQPYESIIPLSKTEWRQYSHMTRSAASCGTLIWKYVWKHIWKYVLQQEQSLALESSFPRNPFQRINPPHW